MVHNHYLALALLCRNQNAIPGGKVEEAPTLWMVLISIFVSHSKHIAFSSSEQVSYT